MSLTEISEVVPPSPIQTPVAYKAVATSVRSRDMEGSDDLMWVVDWTCGPYVGSFLFSAPRSTRPELITEYIDAKLLEITPT